MPLLFAEPCELQTTARRIREHAEDLRRRAALLNGTTDGTQWTSPAATAFRTRVGEVVVRMRSAARHLDASADTLERHARAVSRHVHAVEHLAVQAVKVLI